MSKLLSVAEIIAAPDLASERVEVPEWGGDVIVRALSARDREWFEAQMLREETVDGKSVQKVDIVNGRAKLLSRALIDEDGNAIFDETQLDALGNKSNLVVNRLFAIAQRLSGIGAQAVEDAEKNSVAAPSGASSSA